MHLEDGERIACQKVISNADPQYVYRHMIDPSHRRKHTDRAVERVKPSMGLFVAYFGAEKLYPELAHHTIILGPRYEGLLDDIFNKHVLADDFSLYLHAPTRSDPDLAPPGHEGFYVLSPVPNNRSGIDWEREKGGYLDRILRHLDARYVPGLMDNLVTKFCVTPDYFEHELRSIDGAGFGPEPKLSQSAYFRFHNRSEDIDDLYFVGAGTHPGAGLPGVLSTAKVLERIIPEAETPWRCPGRRAPRRRRSEEPGCYFAPLIVRPRPAGPIHRRQPRGPEREGALVPLGRAVSRARGPRRRRAPVRLLPARRRHGRLG